MQNKFSTILPSKNLFLHSEGIDGRKGLLFTELFFRKCFYANISSFFKVINCVGMVVSSLNGWFISLTYNKKVQILFYIQASFIALHIIVHISFS